MNETENNQEFQMDDESVLSYLLQNVRGLRPVSTGDDLTYDDDISYS
jgi:acyl dehydratase